MRCPTQPSPSCRRRILRPPASSPPTRLRSSWGWRRSRRRPASGRCSSASAGRCRSIPRLRRRESRRSAPASPCARATSTRRTSGSAWRTSTAQSRLRRSCTGASLHLADPRYATPIAAEVADDVLERFLRYVQVDTQSDDDSETYPSTLKQLDLGKLLADELREVGLEDVELTEHGYVFATLPGSGGPTVGLIAHMDPSQDESGTNVQPQVVRNWDGNDIVLPGDNDKVLRVDENPILAERVRHD